MKIFLTGANGYIGKALIKSGCFPLFSDITKSMELDKEIRDVKPELILHLAAKSKVDWCERKENLSEVNKTNVRGTFHVTFTAKQLRIPCAVMSTGQTWKGGMFEVHREHSKRTQPVNWYGVSKVAAESMAQLNDAKIIRTSYVFDKARLSGKTEKLENGKTLWEPTFIRRSFIHLQDFVYLISEYCKRYYSMPDVLHLAGSETVSWYSFMREFAKQGKFDSKLVKPRFWEDKQFAPRPYNGGLDTSLSHSLKFPSFDYKSGLRKMYEG